MFVIVVQYQFQCSSSIVIGFLNFFVNHMDMMFSVFKFFLCIQGESEDEYGLEGD